MTIDFGMLIHAITILAAVVSVVSSYTMMKSTVRFLKKSVEENKKDLKDFAEEVRLDLKGVGAKVGSIDKRLIRTETQLEERLQ